MLLSGAGDAIKRILLKDCEDSSDDDKEERTSMPAEHWANVSHPRSEKHHCLPHFETNSSEKIPTKEQTILAAVAASIIYSAKGLSGWNLADLTLGLYKVHCRHARERAIDTISGHLVTSDKELRDICHYLKWSKAAYQEKTQLVAAELEMEEKDIVKHNMVAAFGQPSYFIGLDHSKKAVVLSVRGTHSAVDVLTDLKPHGETFGDGYAHSGMLNSAKWLQETTVESLKVLMEQNSYKLVVTGHSLGAGAASLLTMLLRKTDENGLTALGVPPDSIKCWAYACPPCVDKTTAMQAKFIRTIVHQDDIVARISPAALEDLRTEILGTEWSHALADGSRRKKVVELAHTPQTVIDKLEPALNLEKGQIVRAVQEQSWTAVATLGSGLAQTWSRAVAGTYGQAASVITNGVTVASTHLTTVHKIVKSTVNDAIDHQLRLIDMDRKNATVTASSMAAEAALTSKEREALLEQNRLFVPGILYHVIRRPLTADEKPPTHKTEKTKKKKSSETTPKYRCLVIRGDDPSSRFRRIVLSSTIISDHMLPSLQNSLSNCINWRPES
ncbi:hypothetical protein R1flu_016608 [Riccia fluitans]|uniref:Fungal lipase-type domain-containing protein n=1 Tax=Riccia fluitans TaxID=41844 RepID=A0ABD1YMC0_9MARC